MGELGLDVKWKKCYHSCASVFAQNGLDVVWRVFKNDCTAQSPPSSHAHSSSVCT